MKAIKAAELRSKSLDELRKLEQEKTENLFNLNIRHAAGATVNSADLGVLRRDLARVKTVLTEKSGG